MNMMQLFKCGDEIDGYCNGYFGRDDYDFKTCVMVAPLYAVFQNEAGYARTLNMDDRLTPEDVAEWKDEAREKHQEHDAWRGV